MKINKKILSIPPYISTSWENIMALHTKEAQLIITLKEGHRITIPDLPAEDITAIFLFHEEFLEQEDALSTAFLSRKLPPLSHSLFNSDPHEIAIPFQLGIDSAEGMTNLLQHNPAQSDLPDIPAPILQKISAIAKIVSSEEMMEMPQAELNCNCMHCQIARAFTQTRPALLEELSLTSEVTLEELTFQQWEVLPQPNDSKLFKVVNRLDLSETYHVYLEPVGCTCGKEGCEHIISVLKS